jgi:hypothetical protein
MKFLIGAARVEESANSVCLAQAMTARALAFPIDPEFIAVENKKPDYINLADGSYIVRWLWKGFPEAPNRWEAAVSRSEGKVWVSPYFRRRIRHLGEPYIFLCSGRISSNFEFASVSETTPKEVKRGLAFILESEILIEIAGSKGKRVWNIVRLI